MLYIYPQLWKSCCKWPGAFSLSQGIVMGKIIIYVVLLSSLFHFMHEFVVLL